MKGRLKGAQKGHSLLKKKADALTLRFRQILTKIIEVGLLWIIYVYREKERGDRVEQGVLKLSA